MAFHNILLSCKIILKSTVRRNTQTNKTGSWEENTHFVKAEAYRCTKEESTNL